jgi:hypothetical protein
MGERGTIDGLKQLPRRFSIATPREARILRDSLSQRNQLLMQLP